MTSNITFAVAQARHQDHLRAAEASRLAAQVSVPNRSRMLARGVSRLRFLAGSPRVAVAAADRVAHA